MSKELKIREFKFGNETIHEYIYPLHYNIPLSMFKSKSGE